MGVEAWTRLWTAASKELSVTTDVDVVTRICRGRIDEAHLRLTLSEDGPFVPGQRGGTAIVELTTREKEILRLVADEKSNQAIAEALFISERTVESHRKSILTKTNCQSVGGLIQ